MQDQQFPLPVIASSAISLLAQSGVQFTSSLSNGNNISETTSTTQAIESISQDFFQKLADLLKLLVTNFLFFFRKYDELMTPLSPYTFSPSVFLTRVHYFTFNVCRPIFPVYLTCLELWDAYLTFTKAVYFSESATLMPILKQGQFPQCVQSIISTLCSSLVSSVYFSDSASFLDSLDQDISDSEKATITINNSYPAYFSENILNNSSDLLRNSESEYSQLLQASLTLLSSLAFFTPKTLLHTISSRLQEGMSVFSQLSNSNECLMAEEYTSRTLHLTLRDLVTSLCCLTYLSEHLVSLRDPSLVRWLLQSLVVNLGVGVSFCDRVDSLYGETIKQDVIKVVSENICLVRCLLASGLIVCVESENLPEVDPSVVILSLSEKDSLVLLLLQCIHHILLSSEAQLTLRLQASQLFLGLVTSANPPGFFPSADLLLNENENSSQTCLQQLINSCCSVSRFKLFSIPVQRVLMRTITVYLLTDEVSSNLKHSDDEVSKKRLEQMQSVTKTKLDILNNNIIPLFSQIIQPETLRTTREDYFAGLCWFNESLASLSTLGGKSRKHLYDCLINSGMLDRLWQCVNASFSDALTSEVDNALFVAHLSLFVQFNDIYGNKKATASMIPGFVTAVLKLLKSLEQTAASSSQLISPIMAHIVRLLTVLVANRNAFVPIASDVLHFSINCLLLNLAALTTTANISSQPDLINVVNCASRNDPELCLALFDLLFRIVSFGFSQLGQDSNKLTTFLRCVLAVFCGGVVDARLIVCCMQGLEELNQQHRLFTLPLFESTWRSQFAQCILHFLLSQPQNDANEVLIKGLYTLYVTLGEIKKEFQAHEFWTNAFLPFMTTLSIPVDEKTDVCGVLSAAFSSQDNPSLRSCEEFAQLLGPFMADLKCWSKSKQEFSAVVKVF